MLDEQQIQEFLQKLREQNRGFPPAPDGYPHTGEGGWKPERLQDLSDHFSIAVNRLQTLSGEEMWLLEREYFMAGGRTLSRELEQAFANWSAAVEDAGGIVRYLEQRQKEKRNKTRCPFSLVPEPLNR